MKFSRIIAQGGPKRSHITPDALARCLGTFLKNIKCRTRYVSKNLSGAERSGVLKKRWSGVGAVRSAPLKPRSTAPRILNPDLRKILKEEKIGIEERKKIAKGIWNGNRYLEKIGIHHFDLKMENILMVGGIPKIIDFGLVNDNTGRSGYREMGYARRGSKFRNERALCKFI
jgi:serine/threonine protein kinase